MKRLLTVIVMSAILVGGSVAFSVAGIKWITPDQLEPFESDAIYTKSPFFVKTQGTEGVLFYSVVKLPVGKSVKKIQYTHQGIGASAYTQVALIRSLKGGDFAQEYLGAINTSGEGFYYPETNSIHFAKIKSGYTYYIHALINNTDSMIGDIKITYK